MNRETVSELLERRPFEPFKLRLSSDEEHSVRHPELAILGKTKIVIAYPESDRFVITSLLHITTIETIQLAS